MRRLAAFFYAFCVRFWGNLGKVPLARPFNTSVFRFPRAGKRRKNACKRVQRAVPSYRPGCGEPHDDGVCDHKECDKKLTVVQYEKDVELCFEHALEKYGEEFVNQFKNKD